MARRVLDWPCLVEGDRWGMPIAGAGRQRIIPGAWSCAYPGDEFDQVKVGDLLFIIPAHSCLTVQVLRKYLTLDGRQISTLNQ